MQAHKLSGAFDAGSYFFREQGSAIRDTLDNTLALANLKAEPVWESVNSLALIKAAKAGLGITILPEKLLSDSLLLKKVRLIHLDKMEMENQIRIYQVSIPIHSLNSLPYDGDAAPPPERKRKETAAQSAFDVYKDNISYDIRFDLSDYYGGLHCGDFFDVFVRYRLSRLQQ